MTKSLAGALVAAVALLVLGCTKSSDEGGGTGKESFRIVVPTMASEVKQGEVVTVRVAIERGGAFKQAVKLEVKAPSGLSVEPKTTTVDPGDKGDIQLKITAAKDAALGEQKIFVRGTPDQGVPTESDFKIKVIAK